MKSFHIRRFSGIETKYEASDQDRGTLRRAVGVMLAPLGAVCTGPVWNTLWQSADSCGANIAAALTTAGANASKVHFITITRSSEVLLVAWDMNGVTPRGIWHVGTGKNPKSFNSTSASTIATPAGVYRDKTASLQWFGKWINGRLYLGNGTDTNLIWKDGGLYELGPAATATDMDDLSRVRIPPCTTFAQDQDGVLRAAGNVTYPLRVWETDKPTARFPRPEGLASSSAYRDITSESTNKVTALATIGRMVYAYLQGGGCVPIVPNLSPIIAAPTHHAAPPNPACINDNRRQPLYLGTDGELYVVKAPPIDDGEPPRDSAIITSKSAGDWNHDMSKPLLLNDCYTIYDEKTDRYYVFVQILATRTVMYCYEAKAYGVTGPIFGPDFICVTQLRDMPTTMMVGINRYGCLLYCDLADVGERALPVYSTALATTYQEQASVGSLSQRSTYVGITADGLGFIQGYYSGFTLGMATPWSDFGDNSSGAIVATRFFRNARLNVMEFNLEDMGDPALTKEFCDVHLHWERNSAVHVGVFAEVDGRQVGKWRGTGYPKTEQICGIGLSGRRLRLRVIFASFNDNPAMLRGVSIYYLESVPN